MLGCELWRQGIGLRLLLHLEEKLVFMLLGRAVCSLCFDPSLPKYSIKDCDNEECFGKIKAALSRKNTHKLRLEKREKRGEINWQYRFNYSFTYCDYK
jgi:hypothetical protein